MGCFPAYLSGHEVMAAHPGGTWQPGYTLEVKAGREEKVENLDCQIITITTSVPGIGPHDTWTLWLAKDRNFIPIRVQGATFRSSRTIPQLDGRIAQWEKIEPGIRMPMVVSVVAYDKWKVRDHNIQIPILEFEIRISKVSLHPNAEDSVFTGISVPDGVPIYTIKPE